ncbi:MAG TPA: heme-degrading domain-containing protein [Devosia sp.]|nr:heme-degrading domain-containing protein [Devosia sp.]
MAKDDDIRLIIEQEKALIFPAFDEAIAFKLGSALRDAAIAGSHGIVADVRTWDRPLFYMALPGTTGDNPNWVRRKANTVQRLMKSSYRVVLEKSWPEDFFPARRGLDNMDYALAGGGFPVRVKGAGLIGAVVVSGLHERDDHRLVVNAICDHLGLDKTALTLPPL